jgi:hypothetical protein
MGIELYPLSDADLLSLVANRDSRMNQERFADA